MHVALSAVVVCCMIICCYGDHPPVPLTGPQQDGCTKYMLEGHGDYKLHRKQYMVRTTNFYIRSLRLLKRTSFYKCEPRDLKYGVDIDGRTWWVDKGCTGLFEITECPESQREEKPDAWKGSIYRSLFQKFETATSNVDLRNINLGSVETRFGVSRFPIINTI